MEDVQRTKMFVGIICFTLAALIQDVYSLQCNPGEYPWYIPNGNAQLDTSGAAGVPQPVDKSGITDITACQIECDQLVSFICKSFSFNPVSQFCELYSVNSSYEGVTKENNPAAFLYEGVCSTVPNQENCTNTTDTVDLAFLVDGSGSICDGDPTSNSSDPVNRCNNWRSLKQFLKDIINSLSVGESQNHIALIMFSHTAEVIFDLNKYNTKTEMYHAIDQLSHPSSNTNTYDALRKMNTEIFNTTLGDRPSAKNIAMVITDGKPTRFVNVTAEEAQQAQDNGIIMYAVGITDNIDETWLKAFSSQPRVLGVNYFTSPDFNSLQQVISRLLSASCISLDPIFTTPPVAQTTAESETTPEEQDDGQLVNMNKFIIYSGTYEQVYQGGTGSDVRNGIPVLPRSSGICSHDRDGDTDPTTLHHSYQHPLLLYRRQCKQKQIQRKGVMFDRCRSPMNM